MLDQKETVRNALEKAKELSGTASDTVALEMLAAEFLGKPVQSIATPVEVQQEAAPSLAVTVTSVSAEVFKAAGVMAVLEAFEAAFPDVELEVKLPPQ